MSGESQTWEIGEIREIGERRGEGVSRDTWETAMVAVEEQRLTSSGGAR